MLEYEKAKSKLDAQQQQQSYSAPSSYPAPSHGHAYYAQPPAYASAYPPAYGGFPPSAAAYAPPPPALGSTGHPISVSIIKEPEAPKGRLPPFSNALLRILPIIGLVALVAWLLPSVSSGPFMQSRIKEFKHDGDVPKVLFQDVKGCDEAKAELEEIVAYLRNPAHFEKLGGKMVKGILLIGPPGTGKTLLAKAVAGEAHVPFFSCSGSDFEEMFVGVGARRIRDLFAAARRKSPSLIFIDEIDAVGSKRSGRDVQAARLSLNQLLVEMDGFDKSTGVIVIAATNLPGILDNALTRPGRFDRHVDVPVPDVKGRKAILDLYAQKIPMAADVDLDVVARGTPGCTGAELFNLINSAALKASAKGMTSVTMKEMEYAKDKILMGAERPNSMSAKDMRMTAYHEGGHALVALYTQHAMPLYKATILPRGQSLGSTHLLPENDMLTFTKAQLMSRIDVCMGGRVAEELIFGADQVSTGASNDLQVATSTARAMMSKFGMSEEMGLSVLDDEELSPAKKQRLDAEVDKLLKESYARATAILQTHMRHLHSIAEALQQKETLTATEMRELLTKEQLIGENEVEKLKKVEHMDEKEAQEKSKRLDELIKPEADEKKEDKPGKGDKEEQGGKGEQEGKEETKKPGGVGVVGGIGLPGPSLT